VTTHIRSYPYCEPSSCIPVTALMAAAFGIIAVDLPAYALSEGYCLRKKGGVFPVTILSFVQLRLAFCFSVTNRSNVC